MANRTSSCTIELDQVTVSRLAGRYSAARLGANLLDGPQMSGRARKGSRRESAVEKIRIAVRTSTRGSRFALMMSRRRQVSTTISGGTSFDICQCVAKSCVQRASTCSYQRSDLDRISARVTIGSFGFTILMRSRRIVCV